MFNVRGDDRCNEKAGFNARLSPLSVGDAKNKCQIDAIFATRIHFAYLRPSNSGYGLKT